MSTVEIATRTAGTELDALEHGSWTEQSLVDEIDRLRVAEQAAVEQAVEANPSHSAYVPNGRPDTLRRKREKAERRLADLREFELPARARVAAQAARDETARRLEEARETARNFDQPERDALEKAARSFTDFLAAWDELVAAASARERVGVQLATSGSFETEEAKNDALRAFVSTIPMFPASPAVLFDACVTAVTDDHAGSDGFAQAKPDAALLADVLAEARVSGAYYNADLALSEVRRKLRAPDILNRSKKTEVEIVMRDADGNLPERSGAPRIAYE